MSGEVTNNDEKRVDGQRDPAEAGRRVKELMKNDRIRELTEGLKGMTYAEWKRLKMEIDMLFNQKKSELEGSLQLTDTGEVQNSIHP